MQNTAAATPATAAASPPAASRSRGSAPGSSARSRTSRTARTARTLGHQLEHDRLARRAVRVRQVLHALRERAAVREGDGGTPRPLVAAIEDFGRELHELERRLRHAGR